MKEILGFKNNNVFNDDRICPNCGWELNIPIREFQQTWISYKVYDKYTCSKCGLQWQVRQSGV